MATPAFTDDIYAKFDTMEMGDKESLLANMPETDQEPFMQGVKTWKTRAQQPASQLTQDTIKGTQAPAQPLAPDGLEGGMSVGQPLPPEPSVNYVQTPKGYKMKLGGYRIESNHDAHSSFQKALFGPGVLDLLDRADELHQQVIKPAIEAGQAAVRKATGYETSEGGVGAQYRADTLPKEAGGQDMSPLNQYIGLNLLQPVLGEKVFENMPEDSKLKAINDLEQLYNHPIMKAFDYPGGPSAADKAAAFGAKVEAVGKTVPYLMLGPGKFMTDLAEVMGEGGAIGRVVGEAGKGAWTGAKGALVDPNMKPSEGATGGAVLGGGISGAVEAAPKLVKAGNKMLAVSSEYATKFLTDIHADLSGKNVRSAFNEVIQGAQQDLSDLQRNAPQGEGEHPAQDTLAKMGKPVEKKWDIGFVPSVILADKDSAMLVRISANKPAEIVRIKLDDVGLARAQMSAAKHNVDVEYVGHGAGEEASPQVQELLTPNVDRGNYDERSMNIMAGKKVPKNTDLKSTAIAKLTGARERGPLIINVSPEKVDIFRLGSAKAREHVLRTRGADLSGNPEGGGVHEFTLPSGERKRGFLLGTTTGQDLVFTPGHENDRLPGFIDQVVSVDSTGANAKPMSDDEIRALSKYEPEYVQSHSKRRPVDVESYGDMQKAFAEHWAKLPPEDKNIYRVFTEPPKPIKQMLVDKNNPKSPYYGPMRKALANLKIRFGVSEDVATNLLEIAHYRRRAAELEAKGKTADAKGEAKKAQRAMIEGAALWEHVDTPINAKITKPGPPPAEVLPPQGGGNREPKAGKTFTPAPELTFGENIIKQPETLDKLTLNDGRQVTVMHHEGELDMAELRKKILVRDDMGKVFTVEGKDVAFNEPPPPLGLPAGGQPQPGGDRTANFLQAKPPPPVAPPKPPPYYTAGDSKLADDLAYTLRNVEGNEQQLILSSILKQARESGMAEDAISKMSKDAVIAAGDKSRTLAEPSWTGAAGAGGTPPPPPELPSPGSPPPEPTPEGQHDVQDFPAVRAMVKDRSFLERMTAALWGKRFVDPKDGVKLINQTYGAKALEVRKEEIANALKRVSGEKFMSDFSKDYLKVAEGKMSMDELADKHMDIMAKPMVKEMLSKAMLTRDVNDLKIQKLGGLPNKADDEELIAYVKHMYARWLLPPGEHAKLVKAEGALYNEGVAYFTEVHRKGGDSTSAAEAESKAVETVDRLIGADDGKTAREYKQGSRGKSTDSLKHRTLDELERKALAGEAGNLDEYGVKLIRRLLGQNEDGIHAIASTIATQEQIIANLTLWHEVAKAKPEMFSRLFSQELSDAGWMKVPNSKASYGPVAGQWAHPDLYDSLITQPNRMAEVPRWMQWISSWVKGNETSLGPTTTANANFFGNVVYATLAGADPMSGKMPHFKDAIADIHGSWKDPFSDSAARIKRARELGVDSPGGATTEALDNQRQYMGEYARQMTGIGDTRSILRKTYDFTQKARAVAANAYDWNDRAWKLASHYALCEKGGINADGSINYQKAHRFLVGNERLDAAKAARPPFDKESASLPVMTDGQYKDLIEKESAYRITASFPDPTKVSYLIDAGRKSTGVIAKYLTFATEDARIWASVPKRIMRGEKDLGLRMTGAAAAIGAAGYGLAKLGEMNGISQADCDAAYANLGKSTRGFRPFMLCLPFRDSNGTPQFLDLSPYIGWSKYLQGLETPTATQIATGNVQPPTMGTLGTIFKNVLKAPVEGAPGQRWVDETLNRAGMGDPTYQLKLREDQKGMAAALGYLGKDLSLFPKAGPQQAYDIYKQLHNRGPYSEPITPGQALGAAAGFRVIPSGAATKNKSDRADLGEMRGLQKQQVSAGRDIFSQARTVPEAIADGLSPGDARAQAKQGALFDAQKRKEVGATLKQRMQLNKRSTK